MIKIFSNTFYYQNTVCNICPTSIKVSAAFSGKIENNLCSLWLQSKKLRR